VLQLSNKLLANSKLKHLAKRAEKLIYTYIYTYIHTYKVALASKKGLTFILIQNNVSGNISKLKSLRTLTNTNIVDKEI
jgi:hypothetical protein